MYYKVTLLNDSLDKSTADIVLYSQDGEYRTVVMSKNKKMQTHLEKLLSAEYNVISPGKVGTTNATVCVLDIKPNTVEYFQLVPEILSWRGYYARFQNEVYKSINIIDDFFVLKSTDIYTNQKGERIVKVVPKGYVAVNEDGRVVGGGRYINANIDKEGATWTLQENPHEEQTPEERENHRSDWELGVANYHPGVDEETYSTRVTEDDKGYHKVKDSSYVPEGKTLSEHYGTLTPSEIEETAQKKEVSFPSNLPNKISDNLLVYSPDLKVAFDSKFWPPLDLKGFDSSSWYVYEYPEVEESEYDDLIPLIGMSPSFIKGTREGLVRIHEEIPVGDGVKLEIPEDEIDFKDENSTIIINKPVKQKFAIEDFSESDFSIALQRSKESTERWKKLTKYKNEDGSIGVDPRAADIKIPELVGMSATFIGEPRPYQKAVIKSLTEMSQYEAFGGPRGFFGHYLNLSYGLGKMLENSVPVLLSDGTCKAHGDLVPGDVVVDSQGNPTTILKKFDHTQQDLYRVTFSDGVSVEAGLPHLWSVWNQSDREKISQNESIPERRVVSTEEILNSLTALDGDTETHNWSIPYVQPIEYPENKLSVPPYTVGTLLSGDKEDRLIPSEYMTGSIEQRVSLIQGLMDNSGVIKNTSDGDLVEFSTASEALVQQVRTVVLSLGAKVSPVESNETEEVESFTLKFAFQKGGINPFRSNGKDSLYTGYSALSERFITSVEFSRVADASCILVDSPDHTYVLSDDFIITHNTVAVLAAESVLRNRGDLKVGTQVSIITAPSKNIYVWRDEIERFRGEGAVVIDGAKGERVRQWEEVLEKARQGELPTFLVVSGSKFRLGKDTYEDEDGDEKKEIGLDAQYMKLLSLGGKSMGKTVEGGHLGLLVLDETGNYVNNKSSRFTAVSEVTEAVYYGKGITWTLNGDLSGNSATDTISEMSFVNMHAKDDYSEFSEKYTIPDPRRPNSSARIWKPGGALVGFMDKFRGSIYSLNGQTVAGKEYGLSFTPDLETPLGSNWGRVYTDTLEKMDIVMSLGGNKSMRALGMLGILIGASYGSVQPQRVLEYDIGTDVFLKDVKNLMDPTSYEEFREELRGFYRDVTEETVEAGRLPKEKVPTQTRDEAYQRHFSQSSRNIMEKVLESWDNPALEQIMEGIDETIRSSKGKPMKLGVAGFSKRAIQSLFHRLKNTYPETSVTVLKFDGDTAGEEISEQQKAHQNEKDKHVISLVTGAGLYGLSLAGDRGWVFSTWNPAKLGQYGGRYHRSPTQKCALTIVVPSGTSQYIRQVEQRKKDIQEYARSELLDIDVTDDGEVEGSGASASRLVDKLKHYYPSILEKEAKDA